MLNTIDYESIQTCCANATKELCEVASLKPGDIMIVGCSSSEVIGEQIGTYSSPEVAHAIYHGIQSILKPLGIFLAAQCCEHLNQIGRAHG